MQLKRLSRTRSRVIFTHGLRTATVHRVLVVIGLQLFLYKPSFAVHNEDGRRLSGGNSTPISRERWSTVFRNASRVLTGTSIEVVASVGVRATEDSWLAQLWGVRQLVDWLGAGTLPGGGIVLRAWTGSVDSWQHRWKTGSGDPNLTFMVDTGTSYFNLGYDSAAKAPYGGMMLPLPPELIGQGAGLDIAASGGGTDGKPGIWLVGAKLPPFFWVGAGEFGEREVTRAVQGKKVREIRPSRHCFGGLSGKVGSLGPIGFGLGITVFTPALDPVVKRLALPARKVNDGRELLQSLAARGWGRVERSAARRWHQVKATLADRGNR